MARSADGTKIAAALAVLALAFSLAGCATTMQEAARLQLNDARIRAGEASTRVTVPSTTVHVSRVALVTRGGADAFVVTVHNAGSVRVADLPISVGVVVRHRRVFVNARPGLEYAYFGAHLPPLAPAATLTWVYTTHQRLAGGARPFAVVGARPSPALPGTASSKPLPMISVARLTAGRTGAVTVFVHNLSAVPQYQLQVYAFAQHAGRYVAAGGATVDHLGSQGSTRLEIGLVGLPGQSRLELEALPAFLQ